MIDQSKARIGKLDSLRGIAALMVVVFHCGVPVELDAHGLFFWLPVFWDGVSAVILFFLLSGYVLGLQLGSPGRPGFAGYLIRRFMRIWPAFAVTLVLSYLVLTGLGLPAGSVWPIRHGTPHVPVPRDLLQNLLMAGNPYAIVGPAWSLYMEMRLSIVFPLLFLLACRLNFFAAALISVALSVIGSRLVHWDMPEFLLSLADASRYLCLFVIGAALTRPGNPVANLYRRMPLAAIAAGLALAFCCLTYRFIPLDLPAKNYVPWIGVTWLFIHCLYANSSARLLNRDSLLFLGRISYGLYLVHYPVLQVTNAFTPKAWSLLVVLPISVLLAWILNRWVEQPMIRFGRNLRPPSACRR